MKPDTIQRLVNTWDDIANFNRYMEKLDSEINAIKEMKKSTRRKISKKHKYINLLAEDLKKGKI